VPFGLRFCCSVTCILGWHCLHLGRDYAAWFASCHDSTPPAASRSCSASASEATAPPADSRCSRDTVSFKYDTGALGRWVHRLAQRVPRNKVAFCRIRLCDLELARRNVRKKRHFSTTGSTIPPSADLSSLTSTKGSENAPCQEHYRNNCCEIQVERVYQDASLRSHIRLGRNHERFNLQPTRWRAETLAVRLRPPAGSSVGYDVNAPRLWPRVRPRNVLLRFQSPRGY
jgi:hypothetical protein